MTKLLFIFCLLSFFLNLSYARVPKNNFVHYTVEDGLPSNAVICLLQDRLGYIWMGTDNGLVRYDGYNFKTYKQDLEDSSSIQVTGIYSLYEDDSGNLWIGGIQGFSRYNRGNDSFTNYSIASFQNDSTVETWLSVRAISEDDQGNLLLGFGPYQSGDLLDGLFFLDKKTKQIQKYLLKDALHTHSIFRFLRSSTGTFWFAGPSGLYQLDFPTHQITSYRPKNLAGDPDFPVNSVIEDKNGILWIGTGSKGLYSFNPRDNSFKKRRIPKNLWINDLAFDNENNLWIATAQGLLYFNPASEAVHKFNQVKNNSGSINSTNILSIIRDLAGSIWIGTWENGLNRYDPVGTNFQAFVHDPNDAHSLSAGWPHNFAEDINNDIWICFGQDAPFINHFDRQHGIFEKRPGINGMSVSAIFKDSQGKIVAGTWGGNYLYLLKDNHKEFIKVPGFPQMNRDVVFCFHEDSDHNLWFGRYDGLWSYNNNHTLNHFLIDSTHSGFIVGSNNISQIREDNKRNLWLATNNGLFKFNPATEQFTRIGLGADSSKSFLTQDINSLYIDKTGIIWAGTWLGGLNRYDPQTGKIRIYTRKDGLPSNSVQGILGDEENGALWLSTFDGISRFDLIKEKFNNYNVKDGIHANQFADGSAFKTSSGEFIFGGANGFTMFKPEDIRESKVAPKVILTDFKLSNEHVIPGTDSPLKKGIFDTDGIILDHDQNDITFEFIAIHFVNANNNQYAYKLENYENDWRYVGSQRTAIYPNLPPGHYIFRVKAANYNGVWNEEGVKLSVIINPPFWATWWAYGLYILFGAGLLYSIRKFELKRRLEKENKRLLEAENKRKSEELEEARQLQLSMLPKELPQLPNLDIAVYMQTATEVGGDYYDFNVTMDGTLTVVIGDATGHGMKAGTMVTTAKSLFRSYGSNPDILFSFQEFSRCIREMNFGRIAMCLSMLKISDHTLQIATAGMPPTYIYRSKSGKVEEYQFEAMPLGAMEKFPYELKETQLNPGDTVFLLSDGLPELENKNNQLYGYEKIRNGFQNVAKKSPEEIISYFKNEGAAWVNNQDPDDDVTFVVIKVK